MPQESPDDLFHSSSKVVPLDEYIRQLECLREQHSADDWPVQKWLPSRGRHHAPPPMVAFMRVTIVNGIAVPVGQFWSPNDGEASKGTAVIRI